MSTNTITATAMRCPHCQGLDFEKLDRDLHKRKARVSFYVVQCQCRGCGKMFNRHERELREVGR